MARPLVTLDFKHALSKITFSAKNTAPIPDPTKELKIEQVRLSHIAQTGVLSYVNENSTNTYKWGSLTDMQSYIINTSSKTINVAETPLLGDSDNTALFLIPQTLKAESSYLTVTFSYDGQTIERGLPMPGEWEMGNAYNYVISIDPTQDLVEIGAQLVDWGNTFNIISEVKYTYLYVEKSTYTANYSDLDLTTLEDNKTIIDIRFSTNATDNQLEMFYNANSAGDPNWAKPTENTLVLDTAARKITCTLYPNENYNKDTVTIKAGIISTNIFIEFLRTETIDYSDIDKVNEILGQSSSDLIISNSYFVKSRPDIISEYIIPISDQINRFHSIDLSNIDNWEVETVAYDNAATINRINYTKVDSLHNGKYCFKVTIPQAYNNEGNILVAVKDNAGNILWTWHLWMTDYDPNEILQSGQSSTNVMSNSTGSIYRYQTMDYSCHMDRNIGAFDVGTAGQGGLGGRGWLSYQYGRLAPLFGHQARKADGTPYYTTNQDTGTTGVSLLYSIANPMTVFYSETLTNWCSADQGTAGKVWNDVNIDGNSSSVQSQAVYEKSIFDPSPLGWMIPPIAEYSVGTASSTIPYGGWKVENNGLTYVASSGNRYYSTVNIDPKTGDTNIAVSSYSIMWTNTDDNTDAAGLKFGHYTTVPQASHDFNVAHSLGASIRPIYQFKMTGKFE